MIYIFFVVITFSIFYFFFFFNDTATTEIYTLPYTTLFRSIRARPDRNNATSMDQKFPFVARLSDRADRSEEHTSELQSHSDLVCRLLLEKKKQIINTSFFCKKKKKKKKKTI